jgi:hypothetical protein
VYVTYYSAGGRCEERVLITREIDNKLNLQKNRPDVIEHSHCKLVRYMKKKKVPFHILALGS